MHHLLCILSLVVLATAFFRWPSVTYAVPDRCLVPPPRDVYGCEFPRYVFYNNPRGYCDRFVDWSCGRGETRSRNAFETREECEVVCGVRDVHGDRPAAVDVTGFVTLSDSPLMAGSRGREVLLRCSLLEGQLENFTGYATVLLEGEVAGSTHEPTANFAYGGITIPSEATPATSYWSSPLPTHAATSDLPSGTQESNTVTMATAAVTQGTDASIPFVQQTDEEPTDANYGNHDASTTQPQTDDLPADDADSLEKELQSLLLMNEVITLVSEPDVDKTSASGEEESPSRGEGNSSGEEESPSRGEENLSREGSPSGSRENSSGDEENTSGHREISSGHNGQPSIDEPLVRMHISVSLPSQTEGDSDGGNSLASTPLPTEVVEEQNLEAEYPETPKEMAFDYISIGVVALALAMYLVVMGAIVGVAYALRKKKRTSSLSDSDTRRDGPLSEMIMIDLT